MKAPHFRPHGSAESNAQHEDTAKYLLIDLISIRSYVSVCVCARGEWPYSLIIHKINYNSQAATESKAPQQIRIVNIVLLFKSGKTASTHTHTHTHTYM